MSSDQILVKKPLIFATGSEIRKDIAESHGISCEFIKSEVDEELIKLNFHGNDFDKLAIQLATEKALTISDKNKDYFVVGVDQVCSLDEEILNKPGNKDNAIVSLQKLSGKNSSSKLRNGNLQGRKNYLAVLCYCGINYERFNFR